MANEKDCFIIMPIDTPEHLLSVYRDGKDHFKHVLDCLFLPSIKLAGYKPISPKAKGADLIHAEIIKNLENSDIVLCDMSCLNPNVFFEFGIRTSLNKSVCVVKDELTEKVPFDTGILNYQEYQSSLDPWDIEGEKKKLSDHIQASAERSEGENTLWKYFGLKSEAVPYSGEAGTDAKLDYLRLQLDSLQQTVDTLSERTSQERRRREIAPDRDIFEDTMRFVSEQVPKGVRVRWARKERSGEIRIGYSGDWSERQRESVARRVEEIFGQRVKFARVDESPDIEAVG